MTIPIDDIHLFWKNGQYFCSVKLPTRSKPTAYMAMGHDNRNFDTVVVPEIQLAFNMLLEEDVSEWQMLLEMPRLLGYKRATAALNYA